MLETWGNYGAGSHGEESVWFLLRFHWVFRTVLANYWEVGPCF